MEQHFALEDFNYKIKDYEHQIDELNKKKENKIPGLILPPQYDV